VKGQQQAAKDQERESKQQAQLEADKQRIVRVMAKYPAGESKSFIRDATGISSTRNGQAITSLLDDGAIEECGIVKGNHKKPQSGYKLVIG
jgi:hypothetical protein